MLRKFDKLIDKDCGLLDLFDCNLNNDDLKLLESYYLNGEKSSLEAHQSAEKVTIIALRFGHNAIDAEALTYIINALRSPHSTLQKLQFLHNELHPEGLTEISRILSVNTTLTSLEVVDDELAASGARELAASLLINRTLSSLTLINVSLTNGSGLDCLCNSLRLNPTICVLE
mmetsp:Transcript_12387/g.22947  ORF Transcript_12387/g.22947 Transcript_12387/m.22947 type:complete len:173 (-) Transcript_12387:981-1499(-)